MTGKSKVAVIVLPLLIVTLLLVIFWQDICMGISRIGTTLVFVLLALVVGWLLGFVNARSHYKNK